MLYAHVQNSWRDGKTEAHDDATDRDGDSAVVIEPFAEHRAGGHGESALSCESQPEKTQRDRNKGHDGGLGMEKGKRALQEVCDVIDLTEVE